MSSGSTPDPGIRFSMSVTDVDWSRLKQALGADRFDNGRSPDQLRAAFENSHCACIAWFEGQVVGTARALSDNISNAYLVDIWTSSSFRRRGIAREMIRRLAGRLPGQHIYLQTDDALTEVYRRLGFREQPVGMCRVVGAWLAGAEGRAGSADRTVKTSIAETERLILRHFDSSDADAMEGVYCDPEVMRYGRGVQTREWVRDRLRRWVEEDYPQWGFGLWAVVEKSSAAVIGYCGLTHFPDIGGQPEIEVGYRLARSYWGRGYATEAARAVRDYGFGSLGLTRLIALIDPQNVASIRAAEKIGMRHEKDVTLPGYTHSDRVYCISRPEQFFANA
jgi:ribosomal-protein-alanine N-acetyltransferase